MQVVELQSSLSKLGIDPGPLDGFLGPQTWGAVDRLLDRVPDLTQRRRVDSYARPRQLIAAEQTVYALSGIDTGAIDGLVGEQTREARRQWAALTITGKPAAPWRDELMNPRPEDDESPAAVKNVWPRQADVAKFYGKVGENQAMLVTPYPMRLDYQLGKSIKRFSIHEKCHDSALRVLNRVLDHYGPEKIKKLGLDRFAGCLNVRKMRGGSAWSMHAWGIAIDFFAEKNQLNQGRDTATLARPECNKFWELWEAEGWLSLGRARNFDWMHIQAARL